MNSMTGFGSAASSTEQADLEISLKSVNGRYLDLRIHSPRDYSEYENKIRAQLKKRFARGTVDVYIHRKPNVSAMVSKLDVNWKLAEQLNKVCNKLKKDLKISADVDLSFFVRNSDIIKIQESSVVKPSEKKQLFETLEVAAQKLEKERLREGQSLNKELTSYLKQLLSLGSEMKRARAEAIDAIQLRFDSRLEQLKEKLTIDSDRLLQEVALLVDKTDVSEELIRLNEHLKAFQVEMKKKGSVGKKLDFFTQEILREINTIGSKSQNTGLTQLVVESKSVLEKLREQVQNIE